MFEIKKYYLLNLFLASTTLLIKESVQRCTWSQTSFLLTSMVKKRDENKQQH